MRIRLEYTAGSSNKWWMVETNGEDVTTSWGRIGSAGSRKEQVAESSEAAEALAEKLAAAKRKKGYKDVEMPDEPVGEPVLRTPSTSADSDLARLKKYLSSLNKGDFIALQPSKGRWTQSAGHEDAAEAAAKRGVDDYNFVFWNRQGHEHAFNSEGNLTGSLMFYWGGDYETVRAALAEPPAGFEIRALGEGQAFEVLPTAEPADEAEGIGDERSIRARLITLAYTNLKPAETKWLKQVVEEGPAALLLNAFGVLATSEKKLAKGFLAKAAARIVSEFDTATSSDEDTATSALQELFDRLHGAGLTDEFAALVETCLASKATAARCAVADALKLTPTEEASKSVGRLVRMRYPIDQTALASYILIRAHLEERGVDDVALELALDWNKMPGCTYKKAEELRPQCVRIAADAIDDELGWVELACRPDLPKKMRRSAFDHALRHELDASAIARLVPVAQELRVAKKTVQRVDDWLAAATETGKPMFIDAG